MTEAIKNKDTIKYKTKTGAEKTFNTLKEACQKFGFSVGQRVMTYEGMGRKRKATVIGVAKNDLGKERLWFHIDGADGASYFDFSNKEAYHNRGFAVL